MKGDYGIRALIDLAERYGEGQVQSRDIAERQDIPEPYLDQLLTALRKAGFVLSRRGPQGGHMLAHQPEEISLAEVITALEGSLSTIGCLDGTLNCTFNGHCGQQEIWQIVTDATQQVLLKTSIADLLERHRAKQQRAMYYI